MTPSRAPRRRSPPMSNNDLDSIKRKVLLQIELSAGSALRAKKGLASTRKQLALEDAYYDAYDKLSLEIDDLIARACRAGEEE